MLVLAPLTAAALAAFGQSPTFHRTHPKVPPSDCLGCHTAGPEADATPPSGAGTHQRCDGDQCHVKDFYDRTTFQTTKVCQVCHVNKTRGLDAEFVGFPPLASWFYAEISHQQHTDSKDTKLGCNVCHQVKGERVRHAQCVDCHLEQKPTMTDCAGCHRALYDENGVAKQVGPVGNPAPCRVTRAFQDLHPVHLSQKLAGQPITCEHCHSSVKAATSLSELVLTQGRKTMTVSCGPCHRPGGPSKVSLAGDCSKCHQDACMTTFSTIPAWHVVKGGP